MNPSNQMRRPVKVLSTATAAPLMNEARSEARKETT
jgi:hypothetical protein